MAWSLLNTSNSNFVSFFELWGGKNSDPLNNFKSFQLLDRINSFKMIRLRKSLESSKLLDPFPLFWFSYLSVNSVLSTPVLYLPFWLCLAVEQPQPQLGIKLLILSENVKLCLESRNFPVKYKNKSFNFFTQRKEGVKRSTHLLKTPGIVRCPLAPYRI